MEERGAKRPFPEVENAESDRRLTRSRAKAMESKSPSQKADSARKEPKPESNPEAHMEACDVAPRHISDAHAADVEEPRRRAEPRSSRLTRSDAHESDAEASRRSSEPREEEPGQQKCIDLGQRSSVDPGQRKSTPDASPEDAGQRRPGVDIFGQTHPAVAADIIDCFHCGRPVAAGRFAPHLHKCLGKVGRVAQSRAAQSGAAVHKSQDKAASVKGT